MWAGGQAGGLGRAHAHAAAEAQHQVYSVFRPDVVRFESAIILQLPTGKDEALLVRQKAQPEI